MPTGPQPLDEVLALLQGVWVPTHVSMAGRLVSTFEPVFPLTATFEPAFPAKNPWLLTAVGHAYHSSADRYIAGGRLRVGPELGRLTFEHPSAPPRFYIRCAYRLDAG